LIQRLVQVKPVNQKSDGSESLLFFDVLHQH